MVGLTYVPVLTANNEYYFYTVTKRKEVGTMNNYSHHQFSFFQFPLCELYIATRARL